MTPALFQGALPSVTTEQEALFVQMEAGPRLEHMFEFLTLVMLFVISPLKNIWGKMLKSFTDESKSCPFEVGV